MSDEGRQYWITGSVAANLGVWKSITVKDLVVGGSALSVMLLATLSGVTAWFSLMVLAIGVGVIGVFHLRTLTGEVAGDVGAAVWVRTLTRLAGWRRHSGVGVPGILADVTVADVGGTQTRQGMALITVPGRKFADTAVCAVVMLGGHPVGAGEWLREDQEAAQFQTFLNRVAKESIPVDQIDVVTRVQPDALDSYKASVAPVLTGPVQAVGAVEALMDEMAGMPATARSWMVVRMPVIRLLSAKSGTVEDVALECMDRVIRMGADQGLRPILVATPSRVTALVRSLYDPHLSPDDIGGAGLVWDNITAWSSTRNSVATEAGWFHTTGVVAVKDWPWSAVFADVLNPVLVAPGRESVVTIQTQFRLIPPRIAVKKAQVAAAMAEGIRVSNAGKVSSGEEDDQWKASHAALEAVRHGAAGVMPLVRIAVSVTDEDLIRDMRADIETRLMGFTGFTWADGDQSRQFACLAPTCRGIECAK